jgi:SAM-dependent methyltransferase
MDERAWDRVAGHFDEAILNVAEHDRLGLIRSYVDRFSGPDRVAADIGSGVGRALGLLAPNFATVYATDISSDCLAIAEKDLARFHNVEYLHRDLAEGHGLPAPVDLAICINTLLIASLEKREAMLQHLCASVKPGGHVLLVVPSLESALYVSHRLVRINRHSGMSPRTAQRKAQREMSDLDLGIVMVDSIPTKHHLKEELHDLLRAHNMSVLETHKVEYPWSYVLEEPPEGMPSPQPWNWLVVAQRQS